MTLGFHNPARGFDGPPKVFSTVGSNERIARSLRETFYCLLQAGAKSVLATTCAFECDTMARFQADLLRRFYLYSAPFLDRDLPWTLRAYLGVADALRKA